MTCVCGKEPGIIPLGNGMALGKRCYLGLPPEDKAAKTIGPYGDRTDEAAGIVRGWPVELLKLHPPRGRR